MRVEDRITPEHLSRRAVVYLRQSSERQVQNNLESQRLQYAMERRVRELGFKDVEIIDSDLGSSAAMAAKQRDGFQRLLCAVALREVGLIASREISRLLRTDRDFCQLAEVCQAFGTLIADEQTVYDPNRMDDQLVLGIKATMSVAELSTIRMRLAAGKENKARRGELYGRLPPGFVWSPEQKVMKDPNVRIQESMALIFEKFRELWSVRQTFMWFTDNDVELPVGKVVDGTWQIVFQRPKHGFIGNVLHNPMYAGAFVYGRRETELRWEGDRLQKRRGSAREPHEARVFIKDNHEGYIDWETFEENNRMIARNNQRMNTDPEAGAVREGKGLLSGLLRCARCGRKLHVAYWGAAGTNARYLCRGGDTSAGRKTCFGFGGAFVDRRFEEELLTAISPLGVRASLNALDQLESRAAERRGLLERQLQQIEYDADRAFAQYDAVDPRNTLVAPQLERRWNEQLERAEEVRQALVELDSEHIAVAEEEQVRINALGTDFARAWNDPDCPIKLKKRIVRTVVEEIVADEQPVGTLRFTIHWKGGCHTAFTMPRPNPKDAQRTSDNDVDIIRKMAVRYGDGEIAGVLNKLGRRTGKGHTWTQQSVASVRHRRKIKGRTKTIDDPDILSLAGAARYADVCDQTIRKLAEAGLIQMERVVPCAPWEISRTDLDSPRVRSVIEQLKATGRLRVGHPTNEQGELFSPHSSESKE